MERRVLILTGSPGVGKTTVLTRTVEVLKERGYSVGGMVSHEAREGGVRVGFEIIDISNDRRGWLANVNQKSGPQVGKYHINLESLDNTGTKAITEALNNCDVVVVDEIGPMELFSGKFKEATRKALESGKLVIAVVHWKAQDRFVIEAKSREDAETFIVTTGNREKLHELLVEKALRFLKHV